MGKQNDALSTLKEYGWLDDENIWASAIGADGAKYIVCVSGELVTLVSADVELTKESKVFSDSTDRLEGIRVKRGLFKTTLAFSHSGTQYLLRVCASAGKRFTDYFMLLSGGV